MKSTQQQTRWAARRKWIFGSLAIVLSLTFALVVAEIAVRMFIPRAQWVFLDASDDWRPDVELGWTNRYDYHVESVASDSGEVVSFSTNADGILPQEATRVKPAGIFRVMLFGDSTVVGRAVQEPERIHNQLKGLLQKDLRVEVLNAGVQGYSTDQSLLLMRRLIPVYKPDLVFYGLCDNDFEGNRQTEAFGNQKPKCTSSDGRRTECTPPADADKLRIRRFGGTVLASMLQRSALYRFLRPGVFALRARFMTNRYAPASLPLEGQVEGGSASALPGFDLFKALLAEMQHTAKTNGAQFAFYSHPALQEVWDPSVEYIRAHGYPRFDRYWLDRILASTAKEQGVQYWSLIDYFRAQQSRGPFHLLPRDSHCNAAGYALTAERLSEFVSPRTANREQKSSSSPL